MASELVTTAPEGNPSAIEGIARLAPWRQALLMALVALSVGLGVAAALWTQSPSFSTLATGVQGEERAAVLAALERAGIEHRFEFESGTVMVPAKALYQARMALASEDLPQRIPKGMEILNQDPGLGTTQVRERARLQMALELELAHTIASLRNVESARVHLGLPRESAFLKSQRVPTASVLVQVKRGRQLDADQPRAIANLVAGSIPNLDVADVRVVDQDGRTLTERATDELALTKQELDYVRRIETEYVRRVEEILRPLVGPDGVQAEVTASVDFTRHQKGTETFDPDNVVTLSQHESEESRTGPGAGGVPGALSNQPPQAGQAPEQANQAGAAGGAAGASGSRSTERTVNNQTGRSVTLSTRPAGQVERVSVAVLVDQRTERAPDGTTRRVARSPEELAQFEALVKQAVGFDPGRGDTLRVVSEAFESPEPIEPLPAPPLWQEPWVIDLARQVGGALLALIIAFGLLRPLMRNLVGRAAAERALEARQAEEAARLAAPQEGGEGRQVGEDGETLALPSGASRERNLETIREFVKQDPKRAANAIRGMVADGA